MSSHAFDLQAWNRLDMFNQLGNIGSEVGRALTAKHAAKPDRMQAAFLRGMDLFNATITSWQSRHYVGMHELLIAREQFATTILTDQEDLTLEKYFMDYAIVARKRPGIV